MQKPVKVLVISDYSSTNSSRAEAEAVIGLKKAGLDITIMTFPDAEYVTKFRAAGIRVIPFHPEKKLARAEIKFIREELLRGGYDILQLFNNKALMNAIPAAKKIPVKVVTYRGYPGHVHWYDPTIYLKYLHPRVDKIICLTDYVKRTIDRNLFFDSSKTIRIHKGHSPDWYASVKPVNLEIYGIPENAFVAIAVSNVRPVKGIPYVIRSSYHLPEGLPIYFLMVGKNMDSPELKQLIDKSPYKNNFRLTGFVSNPLPLIAASNVLILASVKAEAINRSLIEAMSLGITPIMTNIEGNRELMMEEAKDLIVPKKNPKAIANAILKMYNDPERCRELGRKARDHIQQSLRVEDTVQQMKKLYEELAADLHKKLSIRKGPHFIHVWPFVI